MDKFITGLKRIELADRNKKVMKIFKVYKPCISVDALFYCPVLQKDLDDHAKMIDGEHKYTLEQMMSNFSFWDDIATIGKKVDMTKTKKEKQLEIIEYLKEIDKQLPSFVSVPTDSGNINKHMIVKINWNETLVFPTKTKTNFSICLQLVSPEEYIMRNYYSYKENREKVIKETLSKIQDSWTKSSETPAQLLQHMNKSNKDAKKGDALRLVGSEVRIDRSSEAGKSKLGYYNAELFGSMVADRNHSIMEEEFPSAGIFFPQSSRCIQNPKTNKLRSNNETRCWRWSHYGNCKHRNQ